MSWGERSCIYSGTGKCPNPEIRMETCNPDCRFYRSNGEKTELERFKHDIPYSVDNKEYKIPTKKQIKQLKKKGKLG